MQSCRSRVTVKRSSTSRSRTTSRLRARQLVDGPSKEHARQLVGVGVGLGERPVGCGLGNAPQRLLPGPRPRGPGRLVADDGVHPWAGPASRRGNWRSRYDRRPGPQGRLGSALGDQGRAAHCPVARSTGLSTGMRLRGILRRQGQRDRDARAKRRISPPPANNPFGAGFGFSVFTIEGRPNPATEGGEWPSADLRTAVSPDT